MALRSRGLACKGAVLAVAVLAVAACLPGLGAGAVVAIQTDASKATLQEERVQLPKGTLRVAEAMGADAATPSLMAAAGNTLNNHTGSAGTPAGAAAAQDAGAAAGAHAGAAAQGAAADAEAAKVPKPAVATLAVKLGLGGIATGAGAAGAVGAAGAAGAGAAATSTQAAASTTTGAAASGAESAAGADGAKAAKPAVATLAVKLGLGGAAAGAGAAGAAEGARLAKPAVATLAMKLGMGGVAAGAGAGAGAAGAAATTTTAAATTATTTAATATAAAATTTTVTTGAVASGAYPSVLAHGMAADGIAAAASAAGAAASAAAASAAGASAAGASTGTAAANAGQAAAAQTTPGSLPSTTAARASYTPAALADLVTSLPGWGQLVDFNMFAGYVEVDAKAQRNLFYVLAEEASTPPLVAPSEASAAARTSAAATGAAAGASGECGKAAAAGEAGGTAAAAKPAAAAETPLVLWLSGGPGCSSMGGGLLSELGPLFPQPGGRGLVANPHAWNAFAHTLFVDAWAFSGFSYSSDPKDEQTDDSTVVHNLVNFLHGFLERFPQHATAPLYLAGESFAGHIIPGLADALMAGNARTSPGSPPKVNLKGLLVGNPWADPARDSKGALDFWWQHGLVDELDVHSIRRYCDFHNGADNSTMEGGKLKREVCEELCNKVLNELSGTNTLNVDQDLCAEPAALRRQVDAIHAAIVNQEDMLAEHGGHTHATALPVIATAAAASSLAAARAIAEAEAHKEAAAAAAALQQAEARQAERVAAAGADGSSSDALGVGAQPLPVQGLSYTAHRSLLALMRKQAAVARRVRPAAYNACTEDDAEAYLNRPEVQRALHANQTVPLAGRWTTCSPRVQHSRSDMLRPVTATYRRLSKAHGHPRMLVYSGDVGGFLPMTTTQHWVATVGHTNDPTGNRAWRVDDVVAGHMVQYDNVLFTTVRGAGHLVAYSQPQRLAHLAQRFMSGQPL